MQKDFRSHHGLGPWDEEIVHGCCWMPTEDAGPGNQKRGEENIVE